MIGEVRNDLYVTMKKADLDRGSKKSQKNVEVKVTVFGEKDGQYFQIEVFEHHTFDSGVMNSNSCIQT